MGGNTWFKPVHGLRNSVEYSVWQDMLNRCRNPKVASYPNYGGRGIVVCQEWYDFNTFYTDMGSRPSSTHSIDRIDCNGNYTPENCRWATREEQYCNKRNNHFVTFNGSTKTVAEWSRYTGIKSATIYKRLNTYNWPIEKALTK